MSDAFPPKGKMCHKTGFEKECRVCVMDHGCEMWKQVQGKNPITGEEISRWGCLEAMQDLFFVDMIRKQNGMQAAIESMRNELVKLSVEAMARQERQHREALTSIPGNYRHTIAEPGISLRLTDETDEEDAGGLRS